MKTIKINKEKIKIRTEVDELTFSELTLFQQYFTKILYDIDLPLLDETKQKIMDALDNGQPTKAGILLENFVQGIKTLEFGRNAWIYCFAILLEKNEPTTNEAELLENYDKYSKHFSEKLIKDIVVNFTRAFPTLYHLYQMRAEGLNNLLTMM